MKWFVFRQNNSGGYFVGPETILVKALNAEEANKKVLQEGTIYFNGVDEDMDCPCCGDRWSELWSNDKGTDLPTIYGKVVDPSQYKVIE